MPRIHDRTTHYVPYTCAECETKLGYTTAAEIERMQRRALHLCDECRLRPPALTDRMRECIDATAKLRMRLGRPPLFDEVATELGVARSRVSMMVRVIRDRGFGDEWEAALFGPEGKAKVIAASIAEARHA